MHKKVVTSTNRRAKSLVRPRPNQQQVPNVNFAFGDNKKQVAAKNNSSRFGSVGGHTSNKHEKVGLNAPSALNDTGSNMQNSQKRKAKRTFRPKASNILGLDQEGPISMNNTRSTNRAEMVPAARDHHMISSLEASSIENAAMGMDAKL